MEERSGDVSVCGFSCGTPRNRPLQWSRGKIACRERKDAMELRRWDFLVGASCALMGLLVARKTITVPRNFLAKQQNPVVLMLPGNSDTCVAMAS